ncbi:hypothetical protein MKW92_038461 [Papaver armeniacum]|nr:hypothetical protein MKW92_038461 [Papaver armeniacum]
MAHPGGGGAEAHARSKRYEYRANSSLVLTTDSRPRDTHEPTGEPKTLRGNIDPKRFGDKAYKGRPQELEDKSNKMKKCGGDEDLPSGKRRSLSGGGLQETSVLNIDEEGAYQPKTKEIRAAYEALLSCIQQHLGGQPLDILCDVAGEVIAVLKNDKIKNVDKKREIEKFLNTMLSSTTFDLVVSMGKLITDYQDGAGDSNGDETLDGDIGVAVEFDEDEEDEENNGEEEDAIKRAGAMQMGGIDDDDEMEDANEGMTLNVKDIDAYWLQRKISNAYGEIDPKQRQKLAEDALKVLAESADREVECNLLVLLDFDKFELIKVLLQNRLKIVWCTRLARALDEEERNNIEEEMMGLGPDLASILEQLHATRATAKEWQKIVEKNIREEARRLKDRGPGVERSEMHSSEGTYRSQSKGYEEVHVPAPSLNHLPLEKSLLRYRKVYETSLFTCGESPFMCSNWGGKTNVAMLTILQQIALHRNPDGSFDNSKYKIVYVAPMKSLVAEIVGNLSNRLKHYNVNVKELSGDQSLTRQQIDDTQIIVTTPEKWDIITRKCGDRIYTRLVRLVIIDEIHLLHDNRGPVIESIVTRSVRQIETTKEHIHVALFLRVDPKKGLFHFDNDSRPCPLAQRFRLMNEVCYEKVMATVGKSQVHIFVHSRKETVKSAKAIKDTALANDTISRFLKEDSASREILREQIEFVKSNDLKELLPYGFAIHHDGMSRAGHVQVLVSLLLLHGVLIYHPTCDHQGYSDLQSEKGEWTELSPLDFKIFEEACNWLGYTYLYIRMMRNPTFVWFGTSKPTMGNIELCRLFSLSEEFKYVTVKQDEKMELAKLLDHVPIPVKESLEEPSAKINVLLQAYISKLKLQGLSLTSDMVFITQSIVLKRGWAQVAEKALNLCKMVGKQMWSVQMPLRQTIGGICTMIYPLRRLRNSSAWGEEVGKMLYKYIHRLPHVNLAAHVQPITCTVLRVELTITPDFIWEDSVHGFVEPFWVIVEDNDGEFILHHEYFMLKKRHFDEDHTLSFTWLNSRSVLLCHLDTLFYRGKIPSPSFELLDLQPLCPFFALRNPAYEALYREFKHFNPVQTRAFTLSYIIRDDNTICAEFAVLRNHQKGSNNVMHVVYIAPLEALAKELYRDWERKFGKGLGLRVVEAMVKHQRIEALEKGQVVISTLRNGTPLSRRWKHRKYIQQSGHILEVIVSRMRYIASQNENKIRIVALSTSLANAKNLGEWIGATSHGLFNFPPGVLDIANFEARMQVMTKQTYLAIVQHARE